jgi:hypothetical protein
MRNFCGQCGKPIREDDFWCSDECEEAALTLEEDLFLLADALTTPSEGREGIDWEAAVPPDEMKRHKERTRDIADAHATPPADDITFRSCPGGSVPHHEGSASPSRAGDAKSSQPLPAVKHAGVPRPGSAVVPARVVSPSARAGDHGITERDAA